MRYGRWNCKLHCRAQNSIEVVSCAVCSLANCLTKSSCTYVSTRTFRKMPSLFPLDRQTRPNAEPLATATVTQSIQPRRAGPRSNVKRPRTSSSCRSQCIQGYAHYAPSSQRLTCGSVGTARDETTSLYTRGHYAWLPALQ